MSQFFTKITADHWVAKNSLEEAVKKFARTMDRRLLKNYEVAPFKIKFREKIKELNEAHPRCKPVELEIRTSYFNKEESWICVPQVFQMSVYKVKK